MNVIALKLVTGEDVLGELVAGSLDCLDSSEFVIENAVGIAVVRGKDGTPNVGLSPFPLHGEQEKGKTISIARKHVVYYYTPAEDFITHYNQIFGSGLVVPTPKSLIKG
jgi:hypothetical protein